MTVNNVTTTNPVATTTAANPVVKKVQTPAEQRKAAIKAALVDAGKKLVKAAPFIAGAVLPPAIVGTVYMLLNRKPDDKGTGTGTADQQTDTPDGTATGTTTGTGGADAGTVTPGAEGLSLGQKIGLGAGVVALTVLGIYCRPSARLKRNMKHLTKIHDAFKQSHAKYETDKTTPVTGEDKTVTKLRLASSYETSLGTQILAAGTLMPGFEGTDRETAANAIYDDMHAKFTSVRHDTVAAKKEAETQKTVKNFHSTLKGSLTTARASYDTRTGHHMTTSTTTAETLESSAARTKARLKPEPAIPTEEEYRAAEAQALRETQALNVLIQNARASGAMTPANETYVRTAVTSGTLSIQDAARAIVNPASDDDVEAALATSGLDDDTRDAIRVSINDHGVLRRVALSTITKLSR